MRFMTKAAFCAGVFVGGMANAFLLSAMGYGNSTPAPVLYEMAGPPSDVWATTDAPPIELILAALPAQMKLYTIGEVPMMTLPRPRPVRDEIGALIGGVK